RLLGFAEVDFFDKKRGLEYHRTYRLIADEPTGESVNWAAAVTVPGQLADGPSPNAQWTDVPDGMNTAKKLKALQKTLADFLYTSARLSMFENTKLGLRSEPGEDVQTFLGKCREAARTRARAELQQAQADYTVERQKLVAQLPPQAAPQEPPSMWDPVLSLFNLGANKITLAPPPSPAPPKPTPHPPHHDP